MNTQKSTPDVAKRINDLHTIGDSAAGQNTRSIDEFYPAGYSESQLADSFRGLLSRISKPISFSYLVILIKQLFENPKSGKHGQTEAIHGLLESKPISDFMKDTDGGAEYYRYQRLLEKVHNTVSSVRVNQLDLAHTARIYDDLDLLIRKLGSTPRHGHKTYSQLVVARKLLEIIIILFDEIDGLDELNRLVQRHKVFIAFKSQFESILVQWDYERNQYFSSDFDRAPHAFVTSQQNLDDQWFGFRSRLAGDRTTKLPPPPPPPPPPPEKDSSEEKKKEKGKDNKQTRQLN